MCNCCGVRHATWRGLCGPCYNEVYSTPLWVAIRWLFAVAFMGPERADKFIRPQDRICRARV